MSDSSNGDECFQEGTAPVQAFTSPVVRPTVGADLAPRLGRPPRVAPAEPQESKNQRPRTDRGCKDAAGPNQGHPCVE